jgi:hypothetical protein
MKKKIKKFGGGALSAVTQSSIQSSSIDKVLFKVLLSIKTQNLFKVLLSIKI